MIVADLSQVSSLPGDTLPIVCGGTHYFIQHFLFPPGELSFERPGAGAPNNIIEDPQASSSSSRIPRPNLRWQPPGPLPPVGDKGLSLEQLALLETFWTHSPVWPGSNSDQSNNDLSDQPAAGPSAPSASSRPTIMDDTQLLSLHSLLAAVDPPEAGRWHWRDGRKVRRGLERWWERECARSDAQEGQEASTPAESATEEKGRRAR